MSKTTTDPRRSSEGHLPQLPATTPVDLEQPALSTDEDRRGRRPGLHAPDAIEWSFSSSAAQVLVKVPGQGQAAAAAAASRCRYLKHCLCTTSRANSASSNSSSSYLEYIQPQAWGRIDQVLMGKQEKTVCLLLGRCSMVLLLGCRYPAAAPTQVPTPWCSSRPLISTTTPPFTTTPSQTTRPLQQSSKSMEPRSQMPHQRTTTRRAPEAITTGLSPATRRRIGWFPGRRLAPFDPCCCLC